MGYLREDKNAAWQLGESCPPLHPMEDHDGERGCLAYPKQVFLKIRFSSPSFFNFGQIFTKKSILKINHTSHIQALYRSSDP